MAKLRKTTMPTPTNAKVRQINTPAAVKPLNVNLGVRCADNLIPTSTKHPKVLSPNSTATIIELPSNLALSPSMNPRVNLVRLPKYWNEFLPSTQTQPPLAAPKLPPPLSSLNTSTNSTSNHQQRQGHKELLSTEKVISMLTSNRPNENSHCLLCNLEIQLPISAESELQQKSRLLMETFCKIFSINDVTFDPDSFVCCTNCIEELELLNYCNKELKIMTRQLELARDKLMKIMIQNYLEKTDESGVDIGFDSETSIADELTEDWKLNLKYETLIQEVQYTYSNITLRKKSKQRMRRFEYLINHEPLQTESYSFYNDRSHAEDRNNSPTVKLETEPCLSDRKLVAEEGESEMYSNNVQETELEQTSKTGSVFSDPDWSPYSASSPLPQSVDSSSSSSPEFESSNDKTSETYFTAAAVPTIHRRSTRKCEQNPSQTPIPKHQVFKRRHKKSHNLPGEFKCHLCTNEFFTNEGVKRHLQNKHNVACQPRVKQKFIHHKPDQKQERRCPIRIYKPSDRPVPTIKPKLIRINPEILKQEQQARINAGKFNCRFCRQKSISIKQRKTHERDKHVLINTKKYHCQFCTRVIPCIGKYIAHLRDYHLCTKEVAYGNVFCYYFCDEMNCEECFISHELLETHIQKVHAKFNCTAENCGHIFANKSNLAKHVKNVHHAHSGEWKSNFTACEYCHMDFMLDEDLEAHREGHLVKIIQYEHKCGICGGDFRTKRILSQHRILRHKQNTTPASNSKVNVDADNDSTKWKCRFCKEEFVFKAHISLNRKMHEYKCNPVQYLAKKPCLCNICFLCFGTEEELNSHQTNIHEPNKCKICDIQLITAQGINAHSFTHQHGSSKGIQGWNIYGCKLCKITFRDNNTYAAHNSIFHPGQTTPEALALVRKPAKVLLKCNYGCEVETFGNSYLQRSHHVKYHADIHLAGDAKYCKVCYEVCNTQEELTEHLNGHRTYRCKVCGKEFYTAKALIEHRYILHEPNHPGFTCELCGKVFKTPRQFTVHKAQSHNNKGKRRRYKDLKTNCQYCRDIVKKGGPMNRHLYLNHKEEFLKTRAHFCTLCYAGFDTEEQLGKHRDTKHFKCQFCGKGCATKHNMLSHENTHTGNQPFQCQICSKRFGHDSNLSAHLRTHKSRHVGQQQQPALSRQ